MLGLPGEGEGDDEWGLPAGGKGAASDIGSAPGGEGWANGMESAAEEERAADKWGLPGSGEGEADEGRQLTKEQGGFKGERPPKREAAADGWGLDATGGEVCRSAGFKSCRILGCHRKHFDCASASTPR